MNNSTTIIQDIDLIDNSFLATIVIKHDNGDIFKDYTTMSREELLSIVSFDEVQLMHEYMNKEESKVFNLSLFGYESNSITILNS